MRVMIVIDHPWDESFNFALLNATIRGLKAAGHEIDVLDLHRDGFDPVMRREELAGYEDGKYLDPKIGEYQARIMQAAHLIFIFPVWWEVMPAMLKGFMDKVFLPKWAFEEGPNGTLTPKLGHIQRATVITTMGAPQVIYTSIKPVLCAGTLEVCGVQETEWINFLEVAEVSQEKREGWLAAIEEYARNLR